MVRVKTIDIFNNGEDYKNIVRWSLPAFILFIPVFIVGIVQRVQGTSPAALTSHLVVWFLVLIVGYIVSLPVHELIHALFFKIFGPEGTKVSFGFKSGMLYATCPGTHLERSRFTMVLLAPFVTLSLVYVILGMILGEPDTALALFLLHASGCAGDLYFAWVIQKNPEANMVEDTDVGITLWNE